MKILLTLFVLFFSSSVFAKEYKSIIGFKANIPDDFMVITSINKNDVRYVFQENNFDIDLYDELLSGIDLTNIELIIDPNNLTENYNFNTVPVPYFKINNAFLDEVCDYYQELYTQMTGRNIPQYACEISDLPGYKGKSLYVVHEGFFDPEYYLIQYQFFLKNKNEYITFSHNCEKSNCNNTDKIMKSILRSIHY